jgi:dTDP-4-amino-4,6-dideoxygalactose transaminase
MYRQLKNPRFYLMAGSDKVIVPAHTFVATCSAVVNVGATPVRSCLRD